MHNTGQHYTAGYNKIRTLYNIITCIYFINILYNAVYTLDIIHRKKIIKYEKNCYSKFI